MIKMKPWDPDYGLTWEERTERRLKEAREKQREAERLAVKLRSGLEESKAEIVRLEKELLGALK